MKYVLITGASAGIGKEMAYKFAKEGKNLILVARRKELLNEIQADIKNEFNVDVVVVVADLSDLNAVDELYEKMKKYDIELLINNAGFGDINESIKNYDIKRFRQMINLNVSALTNLTIKFIQDNFDTNKQVINVSSIAGYKVSGKSSVYSGTKFFVAAFTEGINHELKLQGSKMRAKILAPGVTNTEFFDVALKNSKMKNKIYEDIKKRNNKSPKELANYTWDLYNSDATVGIIDRETNEFLLKDKMYDVH